MLEKEIEKRFVKLVKQHGGLCYKFSSPSNSGVPDRIVITKSGRVIFVELKSETGRLSKLQELTISQMKNRVVDARVVKGLAEMEKFIEEVFGSQAEHAAVHKKTAESEVTPNDI